MSSSIDDFKKLKRAEQIHLLADAYEKANTSLEVIKKKVEGIDSTISKIKAINADEVTNKSTNINNLEKKIEDELKEITESKDEINSYYDELFVDEEENNKLSLSTEIKKKDEYFKNLITESENRVNETFNKIESLLPYATSAGLAASYREAQKSYKSVHENKIGFWSTVGHSIYRFMHSTTLLWIGFIVAIGFLFWHYSRILLGDNVSYAIILSKAITGAPILWLAWYLQRTISQRNRLYEEYNHKCRVMNAYDGLMKEISKLGTEDEKKALLGAILETVKDNPAKHLGNNDTFFESLLAKIKLSNPVINEEIKK